MGDAITASEARRRIAAGTLSSEALVKACLDRIAAREGEVQAWAFLDGERALAAARASDDARRQGRGGGLLDGIPVGLKDIVETAEMPTEHGCAFYKGNQPKTDAALVTALKNAGAIVLGKTVTTELATLTPSPTRNPRNLAHTPGGSSAGSAAAVADGMVPLAIGTQTGGSVIRPASFNGIHGFKPTLGLISRRGVMLQSHTLDTMGVYGGSVEDLALMAEALAAHDPNDPVSYPRATPRLTVQAAETPPVAPLFAVVRTAAWDEHATPVLKEAFEELVEALGDRAETIDMVSSATAIDAQKVVQMAENAHYYGPLLKEGKGAITDALRERLEAGLKITARDYLDALAKREQVYRTVAELTTNYTAILTPSATGPAPKGYATTGNPIFNGLWTFLGVPAVTLPLLEADGLPIGVQLVGARRDDGRLLRTARWLEQHVQSLS